MSDSGPLLVSSVGTTAVVLSFGIAISEMLGKDVWIVCLMSSCFLLYSKHEKKLLNILYIFLCERATYWCGYYILPTENV